MSETIISKEIYINGVLTDPTTVKLSDAAATYGVRRTDTDAVVVADNTAMVNPSTGAYTYTFTDPAPGLTYEYVVEFVYDTKTYRIEGTSTGVRTQPTRASTTYFRR